MVRQNIKKVKVENINIMNFAHPKILYPVYKPKQQQHFLMFNSISGLCIIKKYRQNPLCVINKDKIVSKKWVMNKIRTGTGIESGTISSCYSS